MRPAAARRAEPKLADEDMQSQILTAATRMFAAKGCDGTSLQDVAEAVGVRKASLLYHFPSKAALREAVLDSVLSRWKDVLPKILTAATTGKNRFDGAVNEVVGFFRADVNRARLLMRELLDRPEEMEQRFAEHLSPWLGIVTDYIKQGQQSGRVREDVDPEAYVVQIVLLLVGTFCASQVADVAVSGKAPDERRIKELVRIARASLFNVRQPETAKTPRRGKS